MVDVIVVGAGLAGCVLARRCADDGKNVLIIEKQNHIGGTCYDSYDDSHILIHNYGPHIFNTDNEEVWNYANRFADFMPYFHRVLGAIDGKLVPIPFNLESLYALYPLEYAKAIEKKILNKYRFGEKVPILSLLEQDDEDLKELADYIYKKVFLYYTLKQWGMRPNEIGPDAMARIPFYVSRDSRYFQKRFQGMPKSGYTNLMKKMVSHKNIKILLNTDYKNILKLEDNKAYICGSEYWGKIYFTAQIDELFGYCYGELPYRTLDFRFETYNKEFYQEASVINYPNNYSFTRVTEFKHLTGQRSNMTTIVKEYPTQYKVGGLLQPYYPIPKDENYSLYERYACLANEYKGLILCGRLAQYKYFTMSDTIENALKTL